ncbi:MAG: hypothetical protein ACQEVA_13865 [Myxococcota bacterium]
MQFGHSSWLLASSAIVLMTLIGCERLGFETEPAPEPPETDTESQAEPEPWENPPEDWAAPSTELLVYEVGEDDEATDEPDAVPEQPSSETYDARIVVAENAIYLENISALRLRAPSEREQMAAAADAAGLDGIWQSEKLEFTDGAIASDQREGMFKLPAVTEYVGRLAALSDEDEDDPGPTIALDVHPKSPYARLYSVTYSVWEAAPRAKLLMRARKNADDGPIFTMVDATTLPENLGECDPTARPCARPSVEAREQGLQVRAKPGVPEDALPVDGDAGAGDGRADAGAEQEPALPCLPGQQPAREGELPRIEPDNDWTSRVMLLDEALCPSVPLGDDETYDAAGLVELFNDIESMAPGCSRASWTADMQMTWETIGPALGHAAAQTNFVQAQFERPLPKTTPEPSCEGGIPPSPATER